MKSIDSSLSHLLCPLTSEKFDPDYPHRLNPSTGRPLLVKYNLEIASKTLTKNNLKSLNVRLQLLK